MSSLKNQGRAEHEAYVRGRSRLPMLRVPTVTTAGDAGLHLMGSYEAHADRYLRLIVEEVDTVAAQLGSSDVG